jgi:hypothetical protein
MSAFDPKRTSKTGNEADGGQDADRELVMACCNTPELLDATEGLFRFLTVLSATKRQLFNR